MKKLSILISVLIIVLIAIVIYLTSKYQKYQTIFQQNQTILQQQKKISHLIKLQKVYQTYAIDLELKFREQGEDVNISESTINLSDEQILKKYHLRNGFYAGIYNIMPGSGYLDFYDNNILVLSSRGVLVYKKNISNLDQNFKQIKNNINDFIGIKQFQKKKNFSIKDLLIYENRVFISYTEEIKEDCFNTSIIYANINYNYLKFKKLFSSKECIHIHKNVDKEFSAHQTGGRITGFDNNHILLSTGEYKSRFLAQNKESVNGKILKININDSYFEIISMGHRNPQGLYFDKDNDYILETEHGALGGDEINLIEVKKISLTKPLNYGWPIVSAGEHYGGKSEENKKKYEKYPLYKSHTKYGFVEPLKSFVPSIGISEIVKIGDNKYVLGSLRDKSLYFFELKENKIINLKRVEVFERIRDLKFHEKKLYLFLEDTPSIGVISLN